MASAPTRGFKNGCLLAAGIGMVVVNRGLIRAGLRQRGDGWRRGAGLVLKEETATFVLSVFGLKVGVPVDGGAGAVEKHMAMRLAEFLAGEKVTHVGIRRGVVEHGAEARVGGSYTLEFQPWREGAGRFVPPESGAWGGVGSGELLKMVARVMPDGGGLDLWMRVNHVGIDGVPMQEVLSRLEAAWGTREVVFPTPEEFAAHEGVRRCSGGREGMGEVQIFQDFGPVLAWRKRMNGTLRETMTVSAAILWRLAKHKAFEGIYIGTTVDVPATSDGLGRGVGLVVIRPADYFGRGDGLARYVGDFNGVLERVKGRRSESFKILDAAAHVPAGLSRRLLCHALEEGGAAFGSLGVSIIKEGKVFGAPIGDVGQADGFLAIGSVGLPAAGGKKVGCVMVKGRAERIGGYPRILREALGECDD